jgi:uncharacterized membrane protein (DUF485 family)
MAFLAVFVLVLTLASSAIQWMVTKKWGKSQNIIVTIGIVVSDISSYQNFV